MAFRLRLLSKALALVVVFAVMQVYVLASPNVNASGSNSPGMLLGRLILPGNQVVLVNGNLAQSGTTILSGSQLQTPAGIRGVVQLADLGRLEIDPDSNLTVTFDNKNVEVTVLSGNAYLTTKEGVSGNIVTPAGKALANSPRPLPQGGGGPSKGKVVAGAIGFVVIVTVVTIWALKDDESPS
ncbi:MAG TPA: FecR domain-containing protein [Pyrinomonadaceae bacterium]|nr:FecR domain-containing protein [Pyrinomonadaceae bacterium]